MKAGGLKFVSLTALAAMAFSMGESIAVALVKAKPLPVVPRLAAPSSAKKFLCAGDPAQLAQCLRACAAGGQTLHNFCSSLPDPRMRSVCYGLELGSEVACQGFCYLHWGT